MECIFSWSCRFFKQGFYVKMFSVYINILRYNFPEKNVPKKEEWRISCNITFCVHHTELPTKLPKKVFHMNMYSLFLLHVHTYKKPIFLFIFPSIFRISHSAFPLSLYVFSSIATVLILFNGLFPSYSPVLYNIKLLFMTATG